MKLLAIGIALMIVSSGIAFFIEIVGNEKSPADPVRVACVGDSITEGTEYPADLWMLLGANYTVGNFGVGGSTVSLNSQKPLMNETAFKTLRNPSPIS